MSEKLAKPLVGGTRLTNNGVSSTSDNDNRIAGASTHKSSSWMLSISFNILMVAVGIGLSQYVLPVSHPRSYRPPKVVSGVVDGTDDELLGAQGALLFKSLDLDKNGALNSQEFGPIVEKLTGDVCLAIFSLVKPCFGMLL